jgi:hypothetical protein
MSLRIQPFNQALIANTKNAAKKNSKAAKKLSDVALTPWEFNKMLTEPDKNAVKKYAGSSSGGESGSCMGSFGDLLAMGFSC